MRKKRPSAPICTLPEYLAEPAGRSAFFCLLYDEYDRLLATWNGKPIDWRKVCRWAEEEGKLLTNGRVPTPRFARRVWDRVLALKRREAAEEAAREAAAPPAPRLRGKAANLPPPVARSPPPAGVHLPGWPPPPMAPDGSAVGPGVVLHPEAARLMAITNRRSGR